MLSNYVKLALRNLNKNRLYAVINIVGLAIGLAVFMFGNLLAGYERNHDYMFANRDQIFTAGSRFSPDANIGVLEIDSMYTAMAPLIRNEVDAVEAIARTKNREFLISVGEDSFYQSITFADSDLTRIFDFSYLSGGTDALDDPSAVILTRSLAQKLFGSEAVTGKTLSLDHQYDFRVAAVIDDLPQDSHFTSSLMGDEIQMFAPMKALAAISDEDFASDWGNLSMGELTYMLLARDKSRDWLEDQLNAIFQRNAPKDQLDFIPGLKVRPLVEANTMIWEATGIPAIDSIRLLGLMVLIIACVNYTNLATAQSFGRAREVGLRKTFGASRRQLLVQFMVESLTIAVIAMLLAVACLEVMIPLFNQWSGKNLALDYLQVAPFLVLTTVVVGLLAGAYPAMMITRSTPIDSLRNSMQLGFGGSLFRSVMIGVQFSLSIFMLAIVLVVYFQNRMIEQSSSIFPKAQIVLLERVGVAEIRQRHETLQNQLTALPGVENASFSSQVPFQQSNSSNEVSRAPGDRSSSMVIQNVSIDTGFLETYDIPLLAGRALGREVANDVRLEDAKQVNVLINQLAMENLGFVSADDALGQSYFTLPGAEEEDQQPVQFTIVGILPSQNYLGLHNKIKPMAFFIEPAINQMASIRVSGGNLPATLEAIENVWEQINPDYPIQQSFLDDTFNDVYVIFRTINKVLAGFAMLALSLALIGLFGLAAYMAQRRTREIGIRKVLGARVDQIVRLLVWQFSLPVLWSLLVAIPLAWSLSGIYLNFFNERTSALPLIILLASVIGLVTAWLIVAGHALRIASASPIQSLRYE
jgi:putative ABC transport system permease protein